MKDNADKIPEGALQLEEALNASSSGKKDNMYRFYELLFSSTLIIPTTKRSGVIPTTGANHSLQALGYTTIKHDDKHVLPCFTRLDLLKNWIEAEEPDYTSKSFSTLLAILGSDTWLHLNPGHIYGKEFSSWEIELLKHGIDSVPDIICDLCENTNSDIEVRQASSDYDKLKSNLIVLLDAYAEVEAAFLVEMEDRSLNSTEDSIDKKFQKAVLGLQLATNEKKYELELQANPTTNKFKADKFEQLQVEIDAIARNSLEYYREVIIIHNLSNNYNWSMLDNVNPFYIRQIKMSVHQSRFRAMMLKTSKVLNAILSRNKRLSAL